jgi:hypothetical protein
VPLPGILSPSRARAMPLTLFDLTWATSMSSRDLGVGSCVTPATPAWPACHGCGGEATPKRRLSGPTPLHDGRSARRA